MKARPDKAVSKNFESNRKNRKAPVCPTDGLDSQVASENGKHSLKDLQSFVWKAISRPLTQDFGMRKRWVDGKDLSEISCEYIRASQKLTSFERLEIYNQQYWYRLLDCLDDDFPGLKSLLGEKRFAILAKEYLSTHPSSCFTLRDLGASLVPFLEKKHDLIEPEVRLCIEMARFEWARVVAFDGLSRKPIDERYLRSLPPDQMNIGLQPYMTLLDLNYALDQYTIAFNRHERDQSEAGSGKPRAKRLQRTAPWPVQEKNYLVVHRHANTVYLKRVELPAFVILAALNCGLTLSESVEAALSRMEEEQISWDNLNRDIQDWFALWMRLGWLCSHENSSS